MQLWGTPMMAESTTRWVTRLAPQPETLGETLARLREAKNWDQKDVSRVMFGDEGRQSSVSAWELGRSAPSAAALRLLADALGGDLNDLAAKRTMWQAQRRSTDRLPGPAVATEDRPGIFEGIEELHLWDDPFEAVRALRALRTGTGPGAPSPDPLDPDLELGRAHADEQRERAREVQKCLPAARTDKSQVSQT